MNAISLPRGSYSHLAMLSGINVLFGNLHGSHEFRHVECKRNEAILPALLRRNNFNSFACLAMHTRVRTVSESIISLGTLLDSKHHGLDCKIALALRMPIKFALMSREEIDISRIQGVVAHPEASFACRKNLREIGSRMHPLHIEKADNAALAIRCVAQGALHKGYACLGPAQFGRQNGLHVLKESMADEEAMTTFYLLARGMQFDEAVSSAWRIVIICDLPNRPESLVGFLSSLTKWNAIPYPYKILDDVHRFHIEVEVPRGEVNDALACIKDKAPQMWVSAFPVVSL